MSSESPAMLPPHTVSRSTSGDPGPFPSRLRSDGSPDAADPWIDFIIHHKPQTRCLQATTVDSVRSVVVWYKRGADTGLFVEGNRKHEAVFTLGDAQLLYI